MGKKLKKIFGWPWTSVLAMLFGGIPTAFGCGFWLAEFKTRMEHNIEKNQLQQECSEKLQASIENCREAKIREYQMSVDEIKAMVKDLTKRGYGKQKN